MQAAIAAAEAGANVVVAEKADTRHSGSGATGNDHFMCYIPEYHGNDFDEIIRECMETLVGPYQDLNIFSNIMKRSFEVVQKWDSYGIKMRPKGYWNFEGHAMPNRRRYHLKYDGWNQKPVLTQKALSLGVTILNKVAMNELITDQSGRVIGAVGIDISEDHPEVLLFQAKAVILATGPSARMYPAHNPAYLFNVDICPANTGAGDAMAYRAGAKLVNLDLPYVHSGLKHFMRCGKATWIGVLTDINGKPVGPFVTKPTRELGDVTADIWQSLFSEKMADGTGPVYMNCSEISEEDLQYMHSCFVSEGDTSINDYLEQYNISLRKEMVEFGTYTIHVQGLEIGMDAMTSIPGLYGVGDCTANVANGIHSAAVLGQIAGENAGNYIRTVPACDIDGNPRISERIALYNTIVNRENGAHWKEANSTLQQIMGQYVGPKVRSATLLKAASKYLSDLKRYSLEQLSAKNSHELMRCLEVLDMIEVAEAVVLATDNRRESRGPNHRRTDYPFTNPLLNNKFQTIRKTANGVEMEFRDRAR
ncbi:MAG: FAD-binding protein [Peptococcaceae bacterium]|nr:FAD-binding protein [Peptococcaceae bacterium]